MGLILAMAGNAVGMGNFLRFPIQAIENGGGAFIIPYLVCFLIMGIPLLWVEWSMGRFGGRHGNHSTPFILDNLTGKRFWKYFGVFGIFTNIGVAAYYVYIESWTLNYVIDSVFLTFADMNAAQVDQHFVDYVGSPIGLPIIYFVICMALNTWILSKGLSGGIEKVSKVGLPLLIFFGLLLAITGWTIGDAGAPGDGSCPDCNAFLGLNYLWTPTMTSLTDPAVWFAAAGQIFFTISVGMGTIHCYASYLRSKDDIALTAMTAGWMNGFVEIVLGAAVVIPLASAFMGFDWTRENSGFGMAFQTMPYLFNQLGAFVGALGGFLWFGLLFIAGITSSLAMGTPWMGFMQDEFNWGRKKAAWSFGALTFIIALPTVLFYEEGVLDEYDFWTVSGIIVFATAEIILFGWVFGMKRGWSEINKGAELNINRGFRFIIKYVTPALLIWIFFSSVFMPKNNDWGKEFADLASGQGYDFDARSIVGKLQNNSFTANTDWFSDEYQSEVDGTVSAINTNKKGEFLVTVSGPVRYYKSEFDNPLRFKPDPGLEISPYDMPMVESHNDISVDETKAPELPIDETVDPKIPEGSFVYRKISALETFKLGKDAQLTVKEGDKVETGGKIADWEHTNDIFYITMSRLYLLLLFAGLCGMVYIAYRTRQKTGRIDVDNEADEDSPQQNTQA